MATVKDMLDNKGCQVWYVTPATSIKDTIKLMGAKNIGAVVVIDGSEVVGIFSERDYARRAVRLDELSLEDPVSSLMTTPVYYITPNQSVEDCMSLMTGHHFRHLPVLEDGQLSGLISIGDVVKQIIREQDQTIESLEDYIWVHMI
jgi:CBS domain-containing protein